MVIADGFLGSKISDISWKGKIARELYELLAKPDHNEIVNGLRSVGLRKDMIDLFINDINLAYLLNNLKNENSNWQIEHIGQKTWTKIITILMNDIKCDLDIPVSIDVHRLIRLTGSINGKTGFLVQPIRYHEINEFDPFSNPLVFSLTKETKVPTFITTKYCPKIRIKDEIYGPYYEGEKINLPEAVSLFLVCKGVASL